MSWQSYVDDQLISTKMIKNAVIAGHDGNIWAASAGFPVSFATKKASSLCAKFMSENKEIWNFYLFVEPLTKLLKRSEAL